MKGGVVMRRDILDMVPYNGYPLSLVRENPLAVLAEHSPFEVASIMRGELRVREVESRIAGLKSVSRDQAAEVCTWLQSRFPGERNMEIITDIESSERGWFPRGERIRMRTRVSIW